jgi:EVE domain
VSARGRTWILTGSPENFRITRQRGFRLIGMKEGRRGLAEQIEPGDRLVFYLTGLQSLAAIVEVTSEMYEDRTPVWPGKAGKAEAYPWRFDTEPRLVLEEDRLVPAEELAGELEHVRKWPREHWQLAFQGQLRRVSQADAALLERRLAEASAAVGVP